MKCLILSSGFGTRLKSLNINTPKALFGYKGKPLINWIMDKIPNDIDIYVNTNLYHKEYFQCWEKSLSRKPTLCIEQIDTPEKSIGAINSLLMWTEQFEEDVLVIAGDTYFEFNIENMINQYNGYHPLLAISQSYDIEDLSNYGIVEIENDLIVGFEEKPIHPKSSLVSLPCYILPKLKLESLRQKRPFPNNSNLGNILDILKNEGDLKQYTVSGKWFDAGIPKLVSNLIYSGDLSIS